MNEIEKIFRYWQTLTALVVMVAIGSVTFLVAARTWETEREAQTAHKQVIERYLLNEYVSIAEEVHLRLDNWEARQRALAELLGQRADVVLMFAGDRGGIQAADGGRAHIPKFSWLSVNRSTDKLTLPLHFGDLYLGDISLQLSWRQGWSLGGLGNLSVTILGLGVFLVIVSTFAFLLLRRKVFRPLVKRMMDLSHLASISRAVQMVAHDVRAPFHSMRMFAETIKQTSDAEKIRAIIESAIPDMIRDVNEVDEMLTDITSIDKPLCEKFESVDLAAMAERAVQRGISSITASGTVRVDYNIRHRLDVVVDSGKIRRVISNIVRNALQATGPSGRVWIKTRDQTLHGRPFVEICIGNSGSHVSPDDLPHLFDAFFTKGKHNGTGLGLAIARSFVELHGGRIWCQSSEAVGTQFFFTLPSPGLPASQATQATTDSTDAAMRMPERNVVGAGSLTVLIVEDNRTYQRALAELMRNLCADVSSASVSVIAATKAQEALKICRSQKIDLAIVDNDLGVGSASGSTIIQMLRDECGVKVICLHSGGGETPSDSELDLVIPKPMDPEKGRYLLREASVRMSRP